MAFSFLYRLGLSTHAGATPLLASLGPDRQALLQGIIDSGLNSPLTSSMGRLFDAVSALCGICAEPSYEGQAAVELEAALYQALAPQEASAQQEAPVPSQSFAQTKAPVDKTERAYRFTLNLPLINPGPVLTALLDDRVAGVKTAEISLRFHRAVVRLILDVCQAARAETGMTTVALSGGVFTNRFLLTHTPRALREAGFTVLTNRNLPANDGGISYGQAAVAAAQLAQLAQKGIEL
jgi:hydrogenase maturation protein HypF